MATLVDRVLVAFEQRLALSETFGPARAKALVALLVRAKTPKTEELIGVLAIPEGAAHDQD
jgi:hypothetical protein